MLSIVCTTAEVLRGAAGSNSGFFVGATPQNEDEDELYDDTEVTEDDFAEFDMDEDEEQTSQKVSVLERKTGLEMYLQKRSGS